ncbi:MAG: helix-turn-helix domain-containing protein, partial [Bacteroidia bacterium]
ITEVMFDVGYTDTKAFRTIFRKITGLSPAEYRNKYSKIVL